MNHSPHIKNNPVSPKVTVQPKLMINTPGDKYEQEADIIAERVTLLSSAKTPIKPVTGLIGASVQRKCAACEEDEKKKPLMRKAENSNYGFQASPSLVSSLNASKGGGSPIPQETRSFMENAFSTDFSGVRLHTDQRATEMNRGIRAKAFTHGSDIYFNNGQYRPDTGAGKQLLAHELTHVLQQGFNYPASIVQRQHGEEGVDVDDPIPDVTQADADTLVPPGEEVIELDYAFVFTGGPYGQAAEDFIRLYNPQHILLRVHSMEAMFDRLNADISGRAANTRVHIREIIIVTHANAAGGMQIPLARSDVQRHRFFTPWDLADLQTEFRDGLHSRFRTRRAGVVAGSIDEDTTVVVRGCEFGQSEQALNALRSFFGGQPRVWAPTAYQGYENIPIRATSFLHTPEEAFDFLIAQNFLPPELQPAPDEERRAFIARVFGIGRTIPSEFFVVGQAAHDALNDEITAGRGSAETSEQYKLRDDVVVPGGEHWNSSSPSLLGSDTELDALTKEEIENQARALMNPYHPRNAGMLVRLRRAWERKISDDLSYIMNDNLDPLYGLPPESIFGDPNIIGGDAARYGGDGSPHADEFETSTLPSLEATAQGIAAANTFEEGPVISEPAAAGETTSAPVPGRAGAEPSETATGAGGTQQRTVEQIMAELRRRAGDFSKSNPHPTQPMELPQPELSTSPAPQPEEQPEDTSFQLPGITRQFSPLESSIIESILTANPATGLLITSALLLTTATDTTVGIGIQASANAVAGGSAGSGIVIRGGRIIGLYGSLAGNAGVTIGLSAEFQITIINGGLENFTGESVAITAGGGELLVGHGSLILNTQREVIGVSIMGGVGAGITAIEGYMSYQGTVAPMH